MRIGHCQVEIKAGDFDANLSKTVAYLERATRDRVEIVCFPECGLTGYHDTEEAARKSAFTIDSPEVMKVLDRTMKFDAVVIVGFNELRGKKELFNTSIVVYKGHLLGHFSKCTAYMPFHKQGREFPIFEHKGVKFGVIICSDGGFIEPTRILALKGAQIISPRTTTTSTKKDCSATIAMFERITRHGPSRITFTSCVATTS